MTRINCVPVEELTDKHLVAEYRELPRIAKQAYKAYLRNPGQDLPPTYRLGKGHVKFFYDKGAWLAQRHLNLVSEMLNRGFTVNYPTYPIQYHYARWRKDWTPTEEDMIVNRQRIKDRLENMK